MKKSFLSVVAFLFVLSTLSAEHPMATAKTRITFVIVHGAWMAPNAWRSVKELLEKDGQKVILVALPGHGSDNTPPQTLSIELYKATVIKAMDQAKGKVILVGHSLAGVIISAVAEEVPERIEKLVFIGAYVPSSGQSLLDLANKDAQSQLGPSLIPSADKLTLDVKKENITAIFCADASPAVQQTVLKNFRVEPALPFTDPVTLTAAHFGIVDKYYIHTANDHLIGRDLQNAMVAAASIRNVYSLDSSHTPFLSMPDQVKTLLIKISQQ